MVSTRNSQSLTEMAEEEGGWNEEEAQLAMPKLSLEQSVKDVRKKVSAVKHLAREDSFASRFEETRGCRHVVTKIVKHPTMENAVAAFIFANALVIAAQTEVAAQRPGAEQPPVFRVFDLFFTVFFTLELVMRIFAEHTKFITGRNKGWNFFDSLVVTTAVLEECLSASTSTTAIRLLRIMRLVRVIRVIRTLRMFDDLRAMVKGVINSLLSLVWALVLLVMICFITSIFITQIVTSHRKEDTDDTNSQQYEALENNFGSLALTMYSLYKAITGGDDWSRFADPLFKISGTMGLFFCLYVSFSVFAVLNVVTGVFVDNAIKANREDEDVIIMDQNEKRKKHIDQVRSVFRKADIDESGRLDLKEFQKHLEDPCVQAYFRQLELDVEGQGALSLFGMLDFDESGYIDVEEFIFGCGKLKGYARSLDLARMGYGQRQMSRRLMSKVAEQNECLKVLQHSVSCVVAQLGAAPNQQIPGSPDQKILKLPGPPQDASWAAEDHNPLVSPTDPSLSIPGSVDNNVPGASSLARPFRPVKVAE